MIEAGQPPTAILLSAGGNDVTGRRLAKLVDLSNPATPTWRAADLAQPADIAQTVDVQMRAWLEYALDELTRTATIALGGTPIPIVIHGYDYPVPDARHSLAGILLPDMLWLYPSFVASPAPSPVFPVLPAYNQNHVALMQALIERFNQMQKTVAELPRFRHHVIHADLTGTLSNGETNYKDHWDNELHPTEAGFSLLTARLVSAMQNRIATLRPDVKSAL